MRMLRDRWPQRRRLVAAILLLIGVGGCASVAPDAAFEDAKQVAADRLGKTVQWNRGSDADTAAAAAVTALLQKPLSEDAAVQIALLNNRDLQASYEELGIAQADLVQAGLLQNPVFSAELLRGGGTTKYTFGVVEDFLKLLTLSADRRIAESELQRAKLMVGDRVLGLAASVRAAYYRAAADSHLVELLQQDLTAAQAAAELSERQRLAGNATPREQTVRQLAYARATADLARAEMQATGDREALNRLLGLWGADTDWNLPDRLPEVPDGRPALSGLEALAVSRRLDLAASQAALQSATQALQLGDQTRFLSLLGIGIGYERDGDQRLKGPKLEIGLPLFDQGQARTARLQAEQRRRAQQLAGRAIDIRSEVREAWQRLTGTQAMALHYRDVVLPLYERLMAEQQRQYNGMLIGIYDLLQGKREQLEAVRGQLDAARDYWIARADLERAIGGPLPAASEPGDSKLPAPPAAPPAAHHH